MKTAFRRFVLDPGVQAQRARRLVKLLLLVALLVALFWTIPVGRVLAALFAANPGRTAIGMGLGFISIVFTAFELEPLTRHQGIRHGVWKILAINLAVKFYSQFSPSTLVGSGIRWYRLAQPGGKVAEALAALAFFRSLETFLTLATGIGFWLLSGQSSFSVSVIWVLGMILTIVLAWFLVTRYSLPIYQWFTIRAAPVLKAPFWQLILRRLEKFLAAVTVYANIPTREFSRAILMGMISALTGIVSSLYLAWAVGIQIDFLNMAWVLAVVDLATQLPFAVAGGLGIREVTLVALLSTFGVNPELALALSFLIFVRTILFGLIGGMVEGVDALRGKRHPGLDSAPGNIEEP